jgi:hypothetical protein
MDLPENDTPNSLRPDLSVYGINEVDRGICLDTLENRKILRTNKLTWYPIFDHEGRPDPNLIQAVSPEMKSTQRAASIDFRSKIMIDPEDYNSDYLEGINLVLAPEAEEIAPAWVVAAARKWHGYVLHPETKHDSKLISAPRRCRYIKSDKARCLHWTSGRYDSDGYCRVHMRTANHEDGAGMAMIRARNRIRQAATAAVDAMENLMENAESDAVKLRAAENLLDRAGIRGGMEIDIAHHEVKSAAEVIRERLDQFQSNARELEAMRIAELEEIVITVEPEENTEKND